jgi:hypothetical protein
MNLFRILLLSSLLWPLARAEQATALLRPGESLTYRVGWGVLGNAGEMKIGAETETGDDGGERLRVTTVSKTRGFVRALYSFDGSASMVFDPRDGRFLEASASTRSKKEQTQASIAFDYQKKEAAYVDHLQPKRSTTMPLPEGQSMDLITALIQTRVWDLEPGQSRDVQVLFDDEFYPLRITAEHEETISTSGGPRQTMLLIPRMIGKPKGMFRRGGEVRVWVSADDDRLPLRFEVKLKVGTAFAVLTDYHPPAKL